MNDLDPEFDRFSASYEQLLKDPLRDRFAANGTEFFHSRKRDLILDYFRRRRIDTHGLAYLDLGCGKGELVCLLRDAFAKVAGCDPSGQMLKAGGLDARGIEARVQVDPGSIPFDPGAFDFVTAVCVFHHVPPQARAALAREMRRVLKPGGVAAIIEHNPFNPITRLIVSRTPVDADAILLRPMETRGLFEKTGFAVDQSQYFLYFPQTVYHRIGKLESKLAKIPLGGQYTVFGRAV